MSLKGKNLVYQTSCGSRFLHALERSKAGTISLTRGLKNCTKSTDIQRPSSRMQGCLSGAFISALCCSKLAVECVDLILQDNLVLTGRILVLRIFRPLSSTHPNFSVLFIGDISSGEWVSYCWYSLHFCVLTL
jgi:hypothetical protein